jgi:hypothetical protein
MPGVAVGTGVAVIVGEGKGVEVMLIAGGSVNIGEGGNITGDPVDGGLVAQAERLSSNNPSKHFCKVFFMGHDYSITIEIMCYKFLPDRIPDSPGYSADFFIIFSF